MPIPEQIRHELIEKNVWTENCPVSLDRLTLLDNIRYIDFLGNIREDGQLMVFDVVADSVQKIFDELLKIGFPINKISLINEYDGSDYLSMEDNNTSSFNCRYIAGTTKYSIHSYGLAIDLNPAQNPLITNQGGEQIIQPDIGKEFIDRSHVRPGMITLEVVDVFKKNGFTIWGGDWSDPVDLHHFQLPRDLSEKLAGMSYEQGMALFSSRR